MKDIARDFNRYRAVSAHKGPVSPAGKAAFGSAQKRRREEVSPIKVE